MSSEPSGELPIERKDEIGELARSLQLMRQQITQNLSQLQSNQQELEHLALHDVLTGLPNRRLFVTQLEKATIHARRYGGEVGVLFIDLDDFKHINDQCGHDAGDLVLKTVAQRLLSMLRDSDTVARIGGDEFVVMLGAPTSYPQLQSVAEKMLCGISLPVDVHGTPMSVGASIGISRYPKDGESVDQLMAIADHAMYVVKAHGTSGYRFASPEPT